MTEAADLPAFVSRPQAVHAVFDDVQSVAIGQAESVVEFDRNAEGVLEQDRLGSRGDLPLCILKVQVAGVEAAIDVDWLRACITDRVCHHNVGWHL